MLAGDKLRLSSPWPGDVKKKKSATPYKINSLDWRRTHSQPLKWHTQINIYKRP
jgi:hypothetical protein